MTTDTFEVKINFDHLLWRTRGKDWDYQFVITPKSPHIDGWYSFHKEVFSNREPSQKPINLIGELVLTTNDNEDLSNKFIANCFIDKKKYDTYGRAIKQYLIWFLYDYDISDIKRLLSKDWGKVFIAQAEKLCSLNSVYEISKLRAKNFIILENAIEDLQQIKFEDIGKIIRRLPEQEPLTHSHLDVKPFKKDFEDDIDKAIKRGENWAALEFIQSKGRIIFRKLKQIEKKITESSIEHERLLRCLAKSFAGSIEDQFLSPRVENIKKKWRELIDPNDHQKGFDLLVQVLEEYNLHKKLLDLDEYEGKEKVSEWIDSDASSEDECIHNIYLRLKKLAEENKKKSGAP
jgi:hypothetical protein